MKKSKVTVWFDEHKDEIKTSALRLCWLGLGIGLGCVATNYISDLKVGGGLYRLHDEGVVKFFDPSSGLEVGIEKAVEIAKKLPK